MRRKACGRYCGHARGRSGRAITPMENDMYENILLCTDGSRLSDKALAAAIGLAGKTGARLTAYHARDPFPVMPYPEYAAVLDSLRSDEWELAQKARSQGILDRC